MNRKSIVGKICSSQQTVEVRVSHDKIESVKTIEAAGEADYPYIATGLVDLQVNGCYGTDFNGEDLTPGKIRNAAEKLWESGITGFFPTVVTGPSDRISNVMRTIAEACQIYPEVGTSVGGIHLEGPFISPENGPRGAHDAGFVREPDWEQFIKWQDESGGRIKIVTMSPEWKGSAEFISKCTKRGIIVSIGHTSASSDQIRDAVRAGARLSTHLGNGSHLMLPRHPNYIWDQLAEDSLWASVIADGFHLPDSVLKVIISVKGDHTILISDCTKYTGMNPGAYNSPIGGDVILDPGGRLYMAENPRLLAGSASSLLRCVNHLVLSGLCQADKAWKMASESPGRFLDPDVPSGITEGSAADLVLFNLGNEGISILETIKNGETVYKAS